MLIQMLIPNFIFGDERGTLVQLVRDGYSQVNIIRSKAGYKRGGHYHKLNNEAFYLIEGALDLVVRKKGRVESYSFCSEDMFMIPAEVAHDFIFKKDTILVSMYDRGVEINELEKDIYKG